jgi:hypothetical protein
MSAPTYTSLGKEVLRDGAHFADACDPIAAKLIADAMCFLHVWTKLNGVDHSDRTPDTQPTEAKAA